MSSFEDEGDQFEEVDFEEQLDEFDVNLEDQEEELDELSKEFVKALVDKIMQFM